RPRLPSFPTRRSSDLRAEAEQAIMIGADIVKKLHAEGCGMIGTGEMGIGNTTPSAAILTVLAGVSLEESVGKGTGIDDDTLAHRSEEHTSELQSRENL